MCINDLDSQKRTPKRMTIMVFEGVQRMVTWTIRAGYPSG
jgi:hypothetical protein